MGFNKNCTVCKGTGWMPKKGSPEDAETAKLFGLSVDELALQPCNADGNDMGCYKAENFGGDPEGKLAKALERAREKAKQPRKPLKIERLKGESFGAESKESVNQSITSNKIGESLAWNNRILGMAGQWRNGKYDIYSIWQDADIIGYTIVHEEYLEKKLDWMENGVPLGSKSTDIAEITFAGMKIYTGGDGSFPVMGMYEKINDYYARTQNKPHPRGNMTMMEFFDQEDYEKARYEEKKWEYEFVEWVKETYNPAPTYYNDGSPMELSHHVAEKIGQENIPKLLVGARLSLHNPSMPTLKRRDSKSSIWVLEVPDLTHLKTTQYKQNYRGKTEVFINTETTVAKFFSNLKAIYPKGDFREGTRNNRYKEFTINIPSFGEYKWKCNEVMLAYDSVSQHEEMRRQGVKRQKELKEYRLRQEEEMKALKERYGAESFGAESPQVDDEGMLGRIRKVRIVGIEDNNGKKDRKGNPIQNVYFYRDLLDSGEADWRIHTDSEREFLSRFKPDKRAEFFGAESIFPDDKVSLKVWAKDMEKDHLGYFVSKNKDGWETWKGLCGITSDKGVSRGFNVSNYDGSYGRRCRKCLTAYKKMGAEFNAKERSLAKRSWDTLNNVETAVGTVGLAHMIGLGAIIGGSFAFLKGRKSNSKTEQ